MLLGLVTHNAQFLDFLGHLLHTVWQTQNLILNTNVQWSQVWRTLVLWQRVGAGSVVDCKHGTHTSFRVVGEADITAACTFVDYCINLFITILLFHGCGDSTLLN